MARIVDVADAVAAAIAAGFGGEFDGGVSRTYAPRVGLDDDRPDELLAGRACYVVPMSADDLGPTTRAADRGAYRVAVLVVERYADAGTPDDAWVDARVDCVARVYAALSDPRDPFDPPLAGVWPETGGVTVVCDPDVLRDRRAFWSEFQVEYREDA